MFSIYDGREEFYQWDKDRKIIVEDSSIKEVHFCNKTGDCSLVSEVYFHDGDYVANVPNLLLETAWRIHVYGYTGDYTKHTACFKVNARTKPEDYVHTDEELKTWEELENRVEALEQGGGSASKYEQPDWGKGEGEVIEKRYSEWNEDVSSDGIRLTPEEYNNVIAMYQYIGLDEYGEVEIEAFEYDADIGFLYCSDCYVELSTIGEVIYKIPYEYLEKDKNSSSGSITVCSIIGYINEEDMGEVVEFSHTPSEVYEMISNNQPVIFFVYINDYMNCSVIHQEMPGYISIDDTVFVGEWFSGYVSEDYWQYNNTGYSLRRGGNTE